MADARARIAELRALMALPAPTPDVAASWNAEQAYGERVLRQIDECARETRRVLPALLEVAEAALDVRGRWEGALCVVDPPCGACRACRLDAALARLGSGR